MSDEPVTISEQPQPAKDSSRSFLGHAKLISLLTLASRLLGVVRESFAAKYFGASLVASAFAVAFTIPNLFRRLFGEGALSAAFIPLYSQSLRSGDREASARFASASVNLLIAILITLTILGEAVLVQMILWWPMRPDRLLAVKLTAVMLPYVLLVCGTAFLGAILQVHRRFGLVAAAPIVLNVALVVATVAGAKIWNLGAEDLLLREANQTKAIYFVSIFVLIAGVLQVLMLLPALRSVGFRFRWERFWTPQVKKMLRMSVPVAIGAGVLQLSVLLDRGISFLLAESVDANGTAITHFNLLGHTIPYPMKLGAAARLSWAQYLYQFPLGVFAIALATAIFPTLSAAALDADRAKFREGLRRGIQVTLLEGLPASIGLVLVAQPAVRLLFQRGLFTPADTELVAMSVRLYSIAIWAFSLQQILNRAYYAMHDTITPLVMSVVTLAVNLAVELPLVWTRLGEAGMAAGTSVSFILQAFVMLCVLQRKTGSLELRKLVPFVIKLLIATALMTAACLAVQWSPIYPRGQRSIDALGQLVLVMITGGVVYGLACSAMGIPLLQHLLPRRKRS